MPHAPLVLLFQHLNLLKDALSISQHTVFTTIPALTDNISPVHFTIRVVGVVKLLITNPPKMVLTSGIPDPAAKFANRFTNHAASPVNIYVLSILF